MMQSFPQTISGEMRFFVFCLMLFVLLLTWKFSLRCNLTYMEYGPANPVPDEKQDWKLRFNLIHCFLVISLVIGNRCRIIMKKSLFTYFLCIYSSSEIQMRIV